MSKANGNLPAVKDSTALFDYFTYKGDDDFYKENPLPDDESFYNPILPGWYSDPSICTNGEEKLPNIPAETNKADKIAKKDLLFINTRFYSY